METLKQKKAELEKEELKKAITESSGQIEAAQKLGISRMTLYRKMIRHGLGTFTENKMQTKVENESKEA